MNYYYQINAFYARTEYVPLPDTAVSLWHALMYMTNKGRIDNQAMRNDYIQVANATLMVKSGASLSSLKRARKQLIDSGYIEYKAGKGMSSLAKYKVVVLYEPQTEPQEPSPVHSEPQTEPQTEPIKNNINNNIKDLKECMAPSSPRKTRSTFTPPSVDDVRVYCDERNNSIDAEYFVDYYAARGWMLKKNQKMSDWKACVRTWERNEQNRGGTSPPNAPQQFKTAREKSYDAIRRFGEGEAIDTTGF